MLRLHVIWCGGLRADKCEVGELRAEEGEVEGLRAEEGEMGELPGRLSVL